MKVTKLNVSPATVAANLARTERPAFINAQIAKGLSYRDAIVAYDKMKKTQKGN